MAVHPSQTILIVEDSDDDFFATMRAFIRAKLVNPVRRCTNGDQALDYLLQRGEFSASDAPRPGMILLDLNLPGTDGREVLRAIKADAELLKIPVIVLTTSGVGHDIEWCYAAGANSYMQKPVDFEGFFRAIERLKEYWLDTSLLPVTCK
ncbi:MAG TPA: response regulator [Gallionella sp.]|nr:response regulator [Gallionella sp.]